MAWSNKATPTIPERKLPTPEGIAKYQKGWLAQIASLRNANDARVVVDVARQVDTEAAGAVAAAFVKKFKEQP